MKLTGRVALVTGAARGLGRAYALRLAKLGADVVINDVNLEAAKEFGEELTAETVMDEVRALGRRSLGIQADVADRERVEGMVEEILRAFGLSNLISLCAAWECRRTAQRSWSFSSPICPTMSRASVSPYVGGM